MENVNNIEFSILWGERGVKVYNASVLILRCLSKFSCAPLDFIYEVLGPVN